MIISHKYKFIFIKTKKTAGTSIEVFLSQCCGDEDILTPIEPYVEPHRARNYAGWFNPFPEIIMNRGQHVGRTLESLQMRRKFYSHIPAKLVRARINSRIWNSYYKFTVERNPWDKTISHYYWLRHRRGADLSWDDYFATEEPPLNHPIYTDSDGKLLVDQVVKYENLLESLGQVFSNLGIPFNGTLGVNAKSEHREDRRPAREVFTQQQLDRIAQTFKPEISLLGYTV